MIEPDFISRAVKLQNLSASWPVLPMMVTTSCLWLLSTWNVTYLKGESEDLKLKKSIKYFVNSAMVRMYPPHSYVAVLRPNVMLFGGWRPHGLSPLKTLWSFLTPSTVWGYKDLGESPHLTMRQPDTWLQPPEWWVVHFHKPPVCGILL